MKIDKRLIAPTIGVLGVALVAIASIQVHNYIHSDRSISTDQTQDQTETTSMGASLEEPTISMPLETEHSTTASEPMPANTETSGVAPTQSEQNPTTQLQTQKPSTEATSAQTTTAETSTAQTKESTSAENEMPEEETHVENHSASFSFTVYKNVKEDSKLDLQKYLTDRGYHYIKTNSELIQLAQSVLENRTHTQEIVYVLTRRGQFDELADNMNAALNLAATEQSPHNTLAADSFFYNYCGMDYQHYYAMGVGLYRIRKVQDLKNQSGDYSVYALYYYAYTTPGENAQMMEKISEATAQMTGSEYDRILAAHHYLCANVVYDENAIHPHSAYGALVDGKCVCEGYAKAFKLLMEAMNIECDIVINATHAWNEVLLNDKWYMVDVTNDDAHGGPDFPYFLLGSNRLLDETDELMKFFNYYDGTNSSVRVLSTDEYNSPIE